MKRYFLLFIPFIFMQLLIADSLEESISQLSSAAAKEYIGPVISPLGVAMNTGWFRRPPLAEKWNIDLQFSVSAVGAFFSDTDKRFETNANFTFSQSEAETLTEFMLDDPQEALIRPYIVEALTGVEWEVFVKGPTIIGSSSDEIQIVLPAQEIEYYDPVEQTTKMYQLQNDTNVSLGVTGLLENYPIFPMAAPQLTVGTFYGTTTSFRFLPFTYIDEELGKFSYFGFGLQHNPKVWFDFDLPTDITFSLSTQSIKIGSVLNSRASSFGVHFSQTYGWNFLNFTPYAGFLLESSKTEVKYDFVIEYEDDDGQIIESQQEIKFSKKGENNSRFLVGFATRIGVFDLNMDVNLGKYSAFNLTGGVGTTIKF
jgi:hypothetical protein